MRNLDISISGMSCGHCVNAVRAALDRLPGVTIDRLSIGQASVTYDPTKSDPAKIVDAIEDEGYQASVAREG